MGLYVAVAGSKHGDFACCCMHRMMLRSHYTSPSSRFQVHQRMPDCCSFAYQILTWFREGIALVWSDECLLLSMKGHGHAVEVPGFEKLELGCKQKILII